MRLHPLVREAVRLAASGRIGEVVGVRADLSRRFDYDPHGRLYDPAAGGGRAARPRRLSGQLRLAGLRPPDAISAMGALAPTGTDVTVGLQWSYRDGRVAQIYCSAAGPSPYTGLITGTEGWIRLETRLHRATALTVHTDAGERGDRGRAGRSATASATRSPRWSAACGPASWRARSSPSTRRWRSWRLLDEARRQFGVHYPADEEH